MITVEELEKIKNKTLKQTVVGSNRTDYRVLVGMATCGIAAGANEVWQKLQSELKARKIKGVSLVSTGCIGICRYEPIVEVIDLNGDKVTYVKMNADKVARVVSEHLVNGRPCLEYTIGAVYNGK
jgi:NADP-reducing hydrogenase subunit HndB